MRLILASGSPRRRELLARLTSQFEIVASGASENAVGSPEERAIRTAEAKARAVARDHDGIILGADTIVAIDGAILGKPASRRRAREMLQSLSGRTHAVHTGLYLLDTSSGEARSHCETARVTFRVLGASEIDAYLDTGEYRGKAGAYALQGKAARFACWLEGDYTNVIGLPLCRLTILLRDMGVHL